MRQAPALDALKSYSVNVDNIVQMVWQPLYDYEDYDSAGASEFTFFQNPRGQGGRTLEDTNMTSAGQLSSPQNMLVTSMEIFFHSGAPLISTDATGNIVSQAQDLDALVGRGHVQIFVGNKPYLNEVGIEQFPPAVALQVNPALADTTTADADRITHFGNANFRGRKYQFEPLLLPANQNFEVDINFPNGVVAMPSGEDARIGVRLNGWQYRLAQ